MPRLPAPFLVVTVMTLEPLPSSLTNDTPSTKLFPFAGCAALMVRTPVAFVIVKVAVPVLRAVSFWLNESELGLMVATHCGIGLAEGDGVGVAVGVGDALLFPFPLFPSLLLFPCGVAVGDGEAAGLGVGLGLAPSDGGVGLGDAATDGDGDGDEWSTSSGALLIVTSGIK